MIQALKVFIALGFTMSILIFMAFSMDSYTPHYKSAKDLFQTLGFCFSVGYGMSLVLVGGFYLWIWATIP